MVLKGGTLTASVVTVGGGVEHRIDAGVVKTGVLACGRRDCVGAVELDELHPGPRRTMSPSQETIMHRRCCLRTVITSSPESP
jgi:hypothetical protein